MRQNAQIGPNLTGAAAAPERAQEMTVATEEFPPDSLGSPRDLTAMRISYARAGDPIGSVPPPEHEVEDAAEVLFFDKLGERLAFERSGVRLYEALIAKYDASGSYEGGPEREELVHFMTEEHEHFTMLGEVIEELGGDPSAVTPAADLTGVAGAGLVQVVTDPRTTLIQALEAILAAELVDNDCWEALSEMARLRGREDLSARFDRALAQEREHLAGVRRWLAVGQGRAAAATRH
jgi:rubrerythrin